ncbi:nucleotide pyrophosphohydrolase [Bifidobacterium sp. CP2]|uniref:nucleotide pyrophosphohydrolase n=1 Tax=Bifidobacterium sp. CP2 TaxID=2809025 RepID=UPI001BDCE775|nr:nucleotide pyrophosphohydrolase [Bifidobacterium sp. CP2]MBT1181842.1 nucleotide pyrophosphohydrolase [Bifidobacterium sp. CP2]
MISDHVIQAVRAFSRERDWEQFHTPDNLAKSICIEAAELLECYQWAEPGTSEEQDHAAEELADVLTYCIMMADELDVDMDEIVLDKLEKTRRKYPVPLVKGNLEATQRLHRKSRADNTQ